MRIFIFLLSIAVSPSILAVQTLTEDEMSQVRGGLEPEAAHLDSLTLWIKQAGERPFEEQDALDALFAVGKLFVPWVAVLNADLEVVGVDYGEREPVRTEEGISVPLPVFIERVSLHNIRPAVGPRQPTMGTVHFEGIRFHEDAYIFIKER